MPGTILITGATGFLGGLIAASCLEHTQARLVLPVRSRQARDRLVERLAAELAVSGRRLGEGDLARLSIPPLPPVEQMDDLLPELSDRDGIEVLHSAGCLSYHNRRRLEAGNVQLTRAMVRLARRAGARRFVFLSTAYSSGFVDRSIRESLHDEPERDPTEYTRSKRHAERAVAEGGVPYLIVRPSVVIGDSRDGRYGGKAYGVYQLWSAGERFLAGRFPPVLHVAASRMPVNFVHQDAFQAGFRAACREVPDGSVVHLVSRYEGLPTMRDLWMLWLDRYGGPREVHFYDRVSDVPSEDLDNRLKLWLEFTEVNHEIASVPWRFETPTLDRLRADGLEFPDVTLATVERSQTRFVDDSPKVRHFVDEYRARGSASPRYVVHDAPEVMTQG